MRFIHARGLRHEARRRAFLGIAALNWLTRNAPLSPTLRAVLIANLIGFGAVALNDVHGVLSGEAREIAKLFLVVHLAFAAAFLALLLRREDGAPPRA